MLDRTAETSSQSAGVPVPGEADQRPGNERPDQTPPAATPLRTQIWSWLKPLADVPGRMAQVYRESGLRGVARWSWQFFVSQSFSSLTRRIVSLNVAGLVALVLGILYLSQFRAGLIDARV